MPKNEPPVTNADSLDLDHMRAFIAVAEMGSQVRAAKQLRMGPTTVGRYIYRVREYFGDALFEGGGSGPLTSRGVLVEQSFRAAIGELSRTRDRLALERPVLRVGFIRVMRPLVEKALRGSMKSSAEAAFDVRLLELDSDRQERALMSRELDIAVCYARPALAVRTGVETSLVTDQPFALVLPERACVRGKPNVDMLSSLTYACLPRRLSRVADAEPRWLTEMGLAPKRRVECVLGSEILAYAGSGHGYGLLPALWSTVGHDGAVFAPVKIAATAAICAYSLAHVAPWVTRLREDLSAAARSALEGFQPK
jgi:DNA-binding transcriptional LysR family regulator